MNDHDRPLLTNSHWGSYWAEAQDGRITDLRPFEADGDPSPIGRSILDTQDDALRITAPAVRRGWLENGPGGGDGRGHEEFVEVTWDEVSQIVADELTRIRRDHGGSAVYAGSYGWASAGRFHHAQGQLKRFLNLGGGATSSVDTYSFAAAEVVVPHVLGDFYGFLSRATSWESLARDSDLIVAFGGLAVKNAQISQGGTGQHVAREGVMALARAGTGIVNISPLQSDVMDEAGAEWWPIRPSTDTALMLGLAHVLLTEGLHDRAFLDRYTVGFDRFAAYLSGARDGQPKDADWAAAICEIDAQNIRDLARRMAGGRTMISLAYALTRQDHGEQTHWAGIALAAMLGQIGLPGGGVGFGYASANSNGLNRHLLSYGAFPQGENPVPDFIPVARITEMLENPGGAFDYNGQRLKYPDIRMVWWAGGNPFHHHQDLNRLRRAWARPDTVIANEWCWNSLARHADIVLPVTTPYERRDIALTPKDRFLTVMDQLRPVHGDARSDHDIFRGIAARLGQEEAFTEGRSPDEWIEWLYDLSRQRAGRRGVELPSLTELKRKGWHEVPAPEAPHIMLADFRADPEAHPLATPSGKIEIFSNTVAGFGYEDCPGYPVWREPLEWLGNAGAKAPLHMISNQPKTKLHSQLDHGSVSREDRVEGREPVLMHPDDAAARGLRPGQLVRIYNERGAAIAGLRCSETIRPGVIQIATGAWYDPEGDTCLHGNPNVLTPDKGTSRLAQGPIAHSCLVEVAAAGKVSAPRVPNGPPLIVKRER